MTVSKRDAVDRVRSGPATASRSATSQVSTVRKPKRDRARVTEDYKTSMLNVRMRADLKEQATRTLENLGISLPEAVRVFLGRVVREQAMPFVLEVPNAETAAALRDSRVQEPRTFSTSQDMFDALQKDGGR